MECRNVTIKGMKRKICFKNGHRGIARNTPAGKEPSMAQCRAIHMRRSLKARMRDEATRSRHTFSPKDRGKASWVHNPSKYDIQGIDTPHKGRPMGSRSKKHYGKAWCQKVSINGHRRNICRNKEGKIVSNTKPKKR